MLGKYCEVKINKNIVRHFGKCDQKIKRSMSKLTLVETGTEQNNTSILAPADLVKITITAGLKPWILGCEYWIW